MQNRFFRIHLASFLLASWSGCSTGSVEVDLLITDVSIVTVATGTVTPGQSVAVRDGRIVEVGETSAMGSTRATTVIDGSGGYLLPGLWDAHVHFRGGHDLIAANRKLLPLYIANGVTSVRDAGGDITGAVLAWRDSIRAGTLVGPDILTSGPKLDGPTGGWDGSIRLADPSQVPAAIDSLQTLGADYVKIYDGSIGGDVYLTIVEEAERRGLRVTGHMPFTIGFLEAVDRGLDATEHLYYAFKGASPVEARVTERVRGGSLTFWTAVEELMREWDPDAARATFDRMAEVGTAVVPTLHVGRVLAEVADTDHSGDRELEFIDPAVVATYAGRVNSARQATGEARTRRQRLIGHFARMIPPMRDAGVTFLAGSDAGPFNSYVYPGFALHRELEALVGAGLTPREALHAAIISPAEFAGWDDRVGRVEAGYQADLIVVNRNPLVDITATRDLRVVVQAGRPLDRRALDELLSRVRSSATPN